MLSKAKYYIIIISNCSGMSEAINPNALLQDTWGVWLDGHRRQNVGRSVSDAWATRRSQENGWNSKGHAN